MFERLLNRPCSKRLKHLLIKPLSKSLMTPSFHYCDYRRPKRLVTVRDFRSSHWRLSIKKAVLKNFAIFTGTQLCWSHFFKKVAGLQACNFMNKEFQHWRFPVNIAKFLRTPILKNIGEFPCWPPWRHSWRSSSYLNL